MIYFFTDWYGRPVGLTSDPFYRDPMWAACGAAIERGNRAASGMEARQGGDVKQAPSRSDDSPVGNAETPRTQGNPSPGGSDPCL